MELANIDRNAQQVIRPGGSWCDTEGSLIQAHGGGILFHAGVYYWYGENKAGETKDGPLRRVDVIGISCYSSVDLVKWTNHGLALRVVPQDPAHDLHPKRVVERPKVLYNAASGRFLMWLHIDDDKYEDARVGVAEADTPVGPFTYLRSFRPCGYESRDFTVYQDEDGAAYLYFSSDGNATLRIAQLTPDCTGVADECVTAFEDQFREAPAVFKQGVTYFMVSSGCTGWAPNPCLYASAESPMGPWKPMGDPCQGEPSETDTTFDSQATFVLPLNAEQGRFLLMADRWDPEDLGASEYIWLPLTVRGTTVEVWWQDEWSLRGEAG